MLRTRTLRCKRRRAPRLPRLRNDFWCHEPRYQELADGQADAIAGFLVEDLEWTADQVAVWARSTFMPAMVKSARQFDRGRVPPINSNRWGGGR